MSLTSPVGTICPSLHPLVDTSSRCITQELRQSAPMAMAQVTEAGSAVYYTDNSVDPVSCRTGAAAITGGTRLLQRTQDPCSTLQKELVALLLALEHAHAHRSSGGLEVLQRPRFTENLGVIPSVLGSLQSLTTLRMCVRLH